MSFDFVHFYLLLLLLLSQSLWNRAMSFDVSDSAVAGADEVSIPLEQGNVFRLQWGVRALCGKASQSHFPTFSDV